MICVNSVTVYPGSVTIQKGNWYYGAWAEVCPTYADCRDVTWYSNNSSVASVNSTTGYIYANGVGTARIYAQATDGSGCSDYITVTVTSSTVKVSSVELNRSYVSIEEGETFTLSATVCPTNASNKSLTWSSSNTNIASVSTSGKVTAKSRGYVTIIATAKDGSGACDCCDFYITGDILVTSVSLSPASRTVSVGDSFWVYETVCPTNATNCAVTWSTSNSSVATVTQSGLVIAQGAGSATITATAQDGSSKKGYCYVTVNGTVYVDSVEVSRSALTLYKGNTHTLSATVCPTNANNRSVRWSSGNTSIATVSSSGVVTAKAAGKVAIYATAKDGSGCSDYCCVTVKTIPDPVCTPAEEEVPDNTVPESKFEDPIDMYSGAHTLKTTLLTLFGGQGTKLVAEYNSTRLSEGDFGKGWYHNFEKTLEIDGCEARVYSSPSTYSRYTSNDDCTVFTCTAANKNNFVLSVNTANTLPYSIDCNKERTEYYDSEGRLAKIVDHQGFETVISYSDTLITITDSVSGKKLYLEKDSSCKVVRVYDENSRQVTLTYTGELLTAICDANGNTLSYTYNEDGQILTGTDSNSTCYFTNTYDEMGRVATQKDGITGSVTSSITYEDTVKRICTNRNGKTSIRVFDSNGLLTSFTDENGKTKTYTYDSRYNVIKETDALGNSVVKQYNSFNKPTVITDKNGGKTYFTYDSKGNVTKITYPKIGEVAPTESFVYNERSQITSHTDVRGTVTVFTYDVSAMPLTKKVGSRNAIQYSYEGGLLKAQTDALGNTTQYSHNAIGQVITKTDADNKATTYEYDACGNLLKTTDANGQSVVTTYDGNHQKTSVTDALGNKTEYTYNGNMKNTLVKFPDGNTVSYEYDGEDRPIKTTDQAGNVTTVQYDSVGRAISKHFADGGVVNYEYDAVGNVLKETNPKGAVTLKTYDGNGNVLSVADNDGNITRNQYNALGKVVRSVNAMSGATVYEYSNAGDLLSETDPLGNKKVYTYDAFGNMLTARDAKGGITTYTYDGNNNLLTVKDALNNITTYTYNALNQLVSVKDAKNNTVTYGYDALGRRTTITDAKGNIFTTQYDGNGNVIKILDAKGNTVSETTYNSLNLPATVVDSVGKTTTYTYNALGKVASITNGMNYRSEYGYDAVGRNTSVRDANNNQSTVQFDTMGNVTRLAGPLGGATNYTYDEIGRLISETTASGGTVTYGYNELSVKEQLTNAKGQVRKFFYNAKGQIIGYVGVEDSVSYTYDANGNVLTVTDKNGTVSREYDALNRLTKYTDTFGKVIQYEYDSVGNLVRLIYPDNTAVNYTYDANNNLLTVTDWASRVTSYTYDVNNRCIGVVKPDGSVTTTVYDNKQRITSTVEKTASGTVITGYEYTYDALSRIIEEKHLADNTKICYTYDSLDRVTKRTVYNECDEVVSEENYTYDAAGNITDAPNSCFGYDTNNRLTVFNGYTLDYDLDGNLLCDGTKAYKYDSANRLIKAGDHAYTYNAEDVRIRNLCSEYDTTYTYNTNCKLSQLLMKNTNGIVTKYVYGKGLIGEQKCDEGFKTYHFDYRGSTVAITDQSGNITDTFKYDTYGNLVSRTGSSFVIFQYNGRDGVVTDKNGLIYMRARYYSPAMRRFVNADIIPGEISNAVTLNRYAYANGNPVSNVDPFGLSVDSKGNVDAESLYGILSQITDSSKDGLASKMLAVTLDQILSFKNVFTVSNKLSVTIPIGTSAAVSYSTTAKSGKGKAELSAVISDQLDLVASLSFAMGNNGTVTVDGDTISIEYSYDIDKYNTIAASISAKPGISISAGYTITTTDKYDNAVSTSMELTQYNVPNKPSTGKVPVTDSVPAKSEEKETDWSWLETARDIAIATGATVVAGVAIAETVGTLGAGFWNDIPAISAFLAAWGKVFA